ncbi:MAG: hypothetical protein NT005_02365 [Spirochaetes bacterium]|nr:hypothetical protein [Spirochaetota bacterium]
MNRVFALLALSAIAALILVSCVLAPVTIEQRIDRFEAALNGDRTTAYMNLVSGSPEYEANTGKPDLWDIHFPLSAGSDTTPFAIVPDAYTDPLDVQATITGPDGFSKRAKFVMENGGSISEDWRIKDIQLEVAGPAWQSIFGL